MNTDKSLSMASCRHLWIALVCCCVPPWLTPNVSAASIPLPEGFADATGQTGFFASASGGIEAIELATGKVLWQTHEAQRPLLIDGEHLLAQAGTKRNRLRILRLDLKHQGECDFESDPVVFPAWVVTGEAHGRSFTAQWELQKHQLVLNWEASAWYCGKERPTPQDIAAARKHAAGVARIDLRTGQIETLPAAKQEKPAPRSLPDHLEKRALRWQGQVGSHYKVLTLEEKNGEQCFELHSWDHQSKTEQTPKELMRGKRLLARATLDNRILCLHEASPSPDERQSLMPRKKAVWWLFSVQKGELIGRIPEEAGMHAFAVVGQRIFYLVPGMLRGSLERPAVQPQILRVVDLSSGKKLWERPVAGKLFTPPPVQGIRRPDGSLAN